MGACGLAGPMRTAEKKVRKLYGGQGEMAFINFFSKNLFSCNFYIFLSETLVSLRKITKIVELRVRTQTFFPANKKGSPKGALFIGGQGEIRTHGTLLYGSFQDCCLKPLGHLSII